MWGTMCGPPPATPTATGWRQTEAATTPARVQAPPQVILVLSLSTITEQAGVSTVTATLTPAVSVETQVTVSATAVSPAVPGDFTLSGSTLTIPAHQTSSEELVTLTAEDNDVDGPETKAGDRDGDRAAHRPGDRPGCGHRDDH